MNGYEQLVQKRCRHHPNREAVARCPECASFFCRECITEHEDRVLCTSCLNNILQQQTLSHSPHKISSTIFIFSIGFIIIWILFYYMGQILLLIPSSFHEGTFWQGPWSK